MWALQDGYDVPKYCWRDERGNFCQVHQVPADAVNMTDAVILQLKKNSNRSVSESEKSESYVRPPVDRSKRRMELIDEEAEEAPDSEDQDQDS